MTIEFNVPDNPTAEQVKSAIDLMFKQASTSINGLERGLFGVLNISSDNCDIFSTIGSMLKNALNAVEMIQEVTHKIQEELGNIIRQISEYITHIKSILNDLKKWAVTQLIRLLPKGLITILAIVYVIKLIANYFSNITNSMNTIYSSITDRIKNMLNIYMDSLDIISMISCGSVSKTISNLDFANLGSSFKQLSTVYNQSSEDRLVFIMQPVYDELSDIANNFASGFENQITKSLNVQMNGLISAINDLKKIT